jgi:hypothetical protein
MGELDRGDRYDEADTSADQPVHSPEPDTTPEPIDTDPEYYDGDLGDTRANDEDQDEYQPRQDAADEDQAWDGRTWDDTAEPVDEDRRGADTAGDEDTTRTRQEAAEEDRTGNGRAQDNATEPADEDPRGAYGNRADATSTGEDEVPDSQTRQEAADDDRSWDGASDMHSAETREEKVDENTAAPSDDSPDDNQADPGSSNCYSAQEDALHQVAPAGNPHENDNLSCDPAKAASDESLHGEQHQPDKSPESRPGHLDIHGRYPSDYKLAPDAPPPRIDGPHESPEEWADAINPDKNVPARRVNCGDCSRCVDSTWHGFPAVAAAVDYPRYLGENPARMTEWAGIKPVPASMADIKERLDKLGHGSSAIVGCDWKTGRGHWFNAINDGGTAKAVDGQSGKVEAWPPTSAGLGFDESRMRYSDAIYFTPDGKVVRHDHP